jgi:hypothetical protein
MTCLVRSPVHLDHRAYSPRYTRDGCGVPQATRPRAMQPGWRVADVLLVLTCQVRHPLLRLILRKTDDRALHGALTCTLEA